MSALQVGVLGLGKIGRICAGHVLEKLGTTTAYDIDESCRKEFAEAGGGIAASARELGGSVDVVVVSLPNPPAVRAAMLGEDGLFAQPREGLLVIDMSTVDPETSRTIGEEARQRGIRYLDAPVSGGAPLNGGVDGAAAATLTFMIGGEADAYEAALPVLRLLGIRFHHVGPVGSGSTVKLISNLMSGVYTLVAAEGFALGKAAGFTPEQLIEVFRDTDAKSFFLTDYLWPRLSSGNLEPGFSVDLQVKDHRLAAELGHEFKVPMHFNALAIQTYEQMRGHDRGGRDVTDAMVFWAEQAGLDLGVGGESK
jgi:3-hydroxyisobutyrate dehydrogenase-like beta-hydroxyacid dehydrogenase